ncbi:GNAT family N-acetyltransferase [Rhabdothermincola sp.]|uniref:GNAT family N-acetyltransferase n=1 Tax=Rhabdothermincola sp. TaxID=2820405 RepID=UPI002FE15721
MLIEGVDPFTDARWRDLMGRAGAMLFHTPEWGRVLADTYGFEIRATLATDESGEVIGGVPWVQVDGLRSSRLVSLPFSDVCPPLLVDPRAWPPLRDALMARGLPITIRTLGSPTVVTDPAFAVSSRARWHGLTLTDGPHKHFDAFAPSVRRAIRKAIGLGVTVKQVADEVFIPAFMAMHRGVRRHKYGLLAQPDRFIESMRDQFRAIEGWYPLLALYDGEPIAATIYLRHGDALYYKFNASRPDALPLRPNNLLVWEGVRLGCELGCRLLDFGASDDDQPGLVRFKRSFGTDEREIVRLQYVPADRDCSIDKAEGELLAELTGLFTAPGVPDEIAARAGALLYRYFA